MRADYNVYFNELKIKLKSLGVRLIYESDLLAEFLIENTNGWSLIFDCERYCGPSFTIEVKNPVYGRYAVWILMDVFKDLKGIEYGAPTIDNQIKFVVNERKDIFSNVQLYKNEYIKKNEI